MNIKDSVVLVTGANRGLGAAFAQIALARGAKRVYAAARNPRSVQIDGVTPIALDITDPTQAAAAAELALDVTLVINNAGISLPSGVASAKGNQALRQQLDTNLFGTLNVGQAFTRVLQANGGGAMVNVLSALAWINAPELSGYCVSKAATWMATNALRNELRSQGTLVVAVHAGFIDTDMASGFPGPKISPASVVDQTYDAVEGGREEVLADEGARRAQAALSMGAYLRPVGFK